MISAHVIEYKRDRLRLAQLLLSTGIITTTLARHSFGAIIAVTIVVVLVAMVIMFWSATVSTRGQTISVKKGALHLGEKYPKITRDDVGRWTFSRNTAVLYCHHANYRLIVRRPDAPALERDLIQVLGAPTPLEYRGSPTWRLVALCVGMTGIALVYMGSVNDDAPLVLSMFGIPAFIVGFATFAAFSQRLPRRGKHLEDRHSGIQDVDHKVD